MSLGFGELVGAAPRALPPQTCVQKQLVDIVRKGGAIGQGDRELGLLQLEWGGLCTFVCVENVLDAIQTELVPAAKRQFKFKGIQEASDWIKSKGVKTGEGLTFKQTQLLLERRLEELGLDAQVEYLKPQLNGSVTLEQLTPRDAPSITLLGGRAETFTDGSWRPAKEVIMGADTTHDEVIQHALVVTRIYSEKGKTYFELFDPNVSTDVRKFEYVRGRVHSRLIPVEVPGVEDTLDLHESWVIEDALFVTVSKPK